ncbi:response regulator receiver protein [Leptolyngbya sp. Heron Island J]|uniref:response regulator n=1 Tax=Leptolyngbya sp. Heron Island J TaxID=1385935 RepID=UPI0003B9B390|nr:response regulator [Leptolyngbya sp. Heron Island J]ESA36486.1 response regulator receiver protein [Leptolyngbya sp. Heron Island J]
MYESFEAISFLSKTLESRQTGRVHIISEDVEWCLDIIDGKLIFAAHSLQYLNTVETTLPGLGYEALLPVYWQLTKLKVYRRQAEQTGLQALNWTSKVVGAFVQYNFLEVEQAGEILAKLAKDAVEALVGLESATVVWYPFPQELWHATSQGIELTALINHLSERLKVWQSISDRICSPHQRPYCESLDDLDKSVPQGGLSQKMLESLVRLMQGASIRQLAQTIKQDETKLAQLLYPYIAQQTIKLWPPLPPLNRLPWLPTKQQQSSEFVSNTVKDSDTPVINKSSEPIPSEPIPAESVAVGNSIVQKNGSTANTWSSNQDKSNSNELKSSTFQNNNSGIVRPRHLIICIDDSQAMLEKIESYLDPAHFELQTILDPVKAISQICTRKPSLVLMDISMPSISGNSLCSILKRSYMFKDVPIIMISSNTGALNKAKSQVSGAAGYLEKPFSKSQLMDLLDTHLKFKINRME